LAQFDQLAGEIMTEWQIPGLAMAVVRRHEPPLLRCWGVCDIETGAPVAPDTVFRICSVTKSFTATALALLVDEGRLDWDMPVRAALPEFRLRDAVATEQASLRDLLTHRTGLPRHDWVHLDGHLDNAGMLAVLRHLEPSKPFRTAWQYNNLMYLVAGLVLERVSGERWEDFTRDRILLPLGMERATTRSRTCSRGIRIARCRTWCSTASSGASRSARSTRGRPAAFAPRSQKWPPGCASISTR
jgi:CubicO group peptidase (beta-lactamase class C family)